MTGGLDTPEYKELSPLEKEMLEIAIRVIAASARQHAHKRPKPTTLLEEVSELILAFRGKHDDPPELELEQIAGVCVNILWQMYMLYDVNNLITRREE